MLVQVFKGSSFTKNRSEPPAKIITFDLDETLGDFGDMCVLWHMIEPYIPTFMTKIEVFQKLVELFPECIRPGIASILEYLYKKKAAGLCSHVFLYTNNQMSREWVELIIAYFELQVPGLFDQAVCAFKIQDKRIEPMRTTHSKTYNDLIRCTLLPKNSQICFVDNMYHPKMVHERVYYIQPRSYEHGLSREEMVRRLSQWPMFSILTPYVSKSLDGIKQDFQSFLDRKNIETHGRKRDSLAVSQKIMYYLKEYFLLSVKQPKTKKISWSLGRFTRKKR
jgi:hypothetical protein